MKRVIFAWALLAFPVALALPAIAQNGSLTRSFVSSAGLETNPCTITQPCATFATAYTKVGANGIVAALDPGKYGSLIISGPVTINGNGWAAITGPASGTAITINAGSGNVILAGLEIDGAQASTIGIQFNSGGTLEVSDTAIRNFTGSGIAFVPTTSSQLYVSNTLAASNGGSGILVAPGASGTTKGLLDHVKMQGNALDGLTVTSTNQAIKLTVSDSFSVGNAANGITATGSNAHVTVIVRNSTINNNAADGLSAQNIAVGIIVTRSTVSGNSHSFSVTNSGQVDSYDDNNFEDNDNLSATPPTIAYK